MYRYVLLFFFFFSCVSISAQDSTRAERGFLFGLSVGGFTTNSPNELPDVSAAMLYPIVGSDRYLGQNLTQMFPIAFHATIPFRRKWEIGLQYGLGISKGEIIYATTTAINIQPDGTRSVSDYTVNRTMLQRFMQMLQFNISRQLIGRENFLLTIGPGARVITSKISGAPLPEMYLTASAHLRISESYWIKFSPAVSRNYTGIQIGLEKHVPMVRGSKPRHWYIRTYEAEE
ncbi:MAG: hypothetical protein ACRC3B_07775 [Bacteroidia bacterium]